MLSAVRVFSGDVCHMSDALNGYRGRFAPTPSGPLHFGSLVAALGSALDAQAHGGQWLLRIEDVDVPRVVPGAGQAIVDELLRLGFEWTGEVMWQSARLEAYRAALDALIAAGRVYGCGCTRREIADSVMAPDGAPRYPGTCRAGIAPGRVARAWRFCVAPGELRWDDRVFGAQLENVAEAVGDFVLWRADGVFAYQLAVVVDDAAQGISDVVRGADLMTSTARQIALQEALGLPRPRYAHLPVVLDRQGDKLSKQTLAAPLSGRPAAQVLCEALSFLGQSPAPGLARASVAEVWAWARAHWRLDRVPAERGVIGV